MLYRTSPVSGLTARRLHLQCVKALCGVCCSLTSSPPPRPPGLGRAAATTHRARSWPPRARAPPPGPQSIRRSSPSLCTLQAGLILPKASIIQGSHPRGAVPVARAAREENIGRFQGLETGWLARQFLGNRLATSEGAVSNTQLLTVIYKAVPLDPWHGSWGLTPRPKTQRPLEAQDPRPSVRRRPKTQDPVRNGQKDCRALRAPHM